MITKTIYKCETCGATYETEQDAQRCENSHINAEFITTQYFPKNEKYPENLTITMANGHKLKYAYVKPVIVEPSDDPYFTNVSVGRNGNQIVLTAIGERLPAQDDYTWVILADTTRMTATSDSPVVTLSTAATRIFDLSNTVYVKVSTPNVEAAQFEVKYQF